MDGCGEPAASLGWLAIDPRLRSCGVQSPHPRWGPAPSRPLTGPRGHVKEQSPVSLPSVMGQGTCLPPAPGAWQTPLAGKRLLSLQVSERQFVSLTVGKPWGAPPPPPPPTGAWGSKCVFATRYSCVYWAKGLPVLPAWRAVGQSGALLLGRGEGGREMLGVFLGILQTSPGAPGPADPGGGRGKRRSQVSWFCSFRICIYFWECASRGGAQRARWRVLQSARSPAWGLNPRTLRS